MKYNHDGQRSFGVCDFCGTDSSGTHGKVYPAGEKGLCEGCARQIAAILFPFIASLEECAKVLPL